MHKVRKMKICTDIKVHVAMPLKDVPLIRSEWMDIQLSDGEYSEGGHEDDNAGKNDVRSDPELRCSKYFFPLDWCQCQKYPNETLGYIRKYICCPKISAIAPRSWEGEQKCPTRFSPSVWIVIRVLDVALVSMADISADIIVRPMSIAGKYKFQQ